MQRAKYYLLFFSWLGFECRAGRQKRAKDRPAGRWQKLPGQHGVFTRDLPGQPNLGVSGEDGFPAAADKFPLVSPDVNHPAAK
jgi:hypothetical protein